MSQWWQEVCRPLSLYSVKSLFIGKPGGVSAKKVNRSIAGLIRGAVQVCSWPGMRGIIGALTWFSYLDAF